MQTLRICLHLSVYTPPPLPLHSLTCCLLALPPPPVLFCMTLLGHTPFSRLLLFHLSSGCRQWLRGLVAIILFLLRSFSTLSHPPPAYCSSALATSSRFLLFFVLPLAAIVSLVFMRSFVFFSSHSLVRTPLFRQRLLFPPSLLFLGLLFPYADFPTRYLAPLRIVHNSFMRAPTVLFSSRLLSFFS